MTKINAIIVEDSADNRETLKRMLEMECPEIRLLDEAPTLDMAYELIKKLQPDLVFLDIQMKKGTSFDLLERLYAEKSINFEIIFVTAYGLFEYATKAIDYAALDFITKPIDPESLKAAVQKAAGKINSQGQEAQIQLLLENLSRPERKSNRIAFHLTKGIIEFVEVGDIVHLEADGTVTYIYLKNDTKLTAMRNLGYYGKLLQADYNFFPISNSLLVNLEYVKRYNHGELTVSLTNDSHLFASRRGGQEFKKYLSDKGNELSNLEQSGMKQVLKNILGVFKD